MAQHWSIREPEPASRLRGKMLVPDSDSSPLFTQLVQARALEVIWTHYDPKLHIGLESQKPRLRQRGNLRRIGHVHNDQGTAMPILFGEISGLRAKRLQD